MNSLSLGKCQATLKPKFSTLESLQGGVARAHILLAALAPALLQIPWICLREGHNHEIREMGTTPKR